MPPSVGQAGIEIVDQRRNVHIFTHFLHFSVIFLQPLHCLPQGVHSYYSHPEKWKRPFPGRTQMSGGLIVLALVLVYLVYIYFLWRGVHRSDPMETQNQWKHSGA
jgi:hypothetical protein